MREKIGNCIILVVFVVGVCFAWLWWLLFGGFFDQTNYEKREMAEKPVFTIEEYENYATDYNAYFNDNMPFRAPLISLYNSIDYFAFGKSPNEDVIAGKDHWLFYSAVNDGDPIACYEGTNLYSDAELAAVCEHLNQQRAIIEEMGIEFVVFIVPNKERVYSEYMPDKYGEPADVYRTLQVVNYLENNTDVRVIYAYDDIVGAKDDVEIPVWHRLDTHWNEVGGYVGTIGLLAEIGIDMPDINDECIDINIIGDRGGDLAGMIGMNNQLAMFGQEVEVGGYKPEDRGENVDDRHLYMIGDSFLYIGGIFVGAQFENALIEQYGLYSYDRLQEYSPDILVLEINERMLKRIGEFSVY